MVASSDLFANLLAYKNLENEEEIPDYSSVFSSNENLNKFENVLNQANSWTNDSPTAISAYNYSNVFTQPTNVSNLGSTQFNTSESFEIPETVFEDVVQGKGKPINLVRSTNSDAAEIKTRQEQRTQASRQSPGAIKTEPRRDPNFKEQATRVLRALVPSPMTTSAAVIMMGNSALHDAHRQLYDLDTRESNKYKNAVDLNRLRDVSEWESKQGTPSWIKLPPGAKRNPFSFEHAFDKKPEITPSPKFEQLLRNAKGINPLIGLDTQSTIGFNPKFDPNVNVAYSRWNLPPEIAAHELGHAVDHSINPRAYEYRNNALTYQRQSPGIGTALSFRPGKNILESGFEGILTNFGSNSQQLRGEFAADYYGSKLAKGMEAPDIDKSGNPIPNSEINFRNLRNIGAKGTYVMGTARSGFNQGILGHFIGAGADFAKNALLQGVIEPTIRTVRGGQDTNLQSQLRKYGYNPSDYSLNRNTSGNATLDKRISNPVGSFLMNKAWDVK